MPAQSASVISGRLFVRNLSAGHTAVVGVLRFRREIVIHEGQARTALIAGHQLSIGDVLPEHAIDTCSPYSITELLEHSIWPRSAVAGGLLLRFAAAHPDRNEWRVFSAASRQWTRGPDPEQNDFWFDIWGGEVSAIASPCGNTCGSKSGQLLAHPVWPSSGGELHGYPQTLSGLWPAFDLLHGLLADWAEGAMTESEFLERTRANVCFPAADQFYRLDEEYARYLSALRRIGAFAPIGPLTSKEELKRDALSRAAIEAVHAAGNRFQL